MFNVTIHFSDAGDADLHPGMSALVEIELEPRQKRLLVPREAVGKQGDEWVVTLPAGRRHSESKAVRVRSFDALHYEIEEGLSEGESILARWRP
jgi:multidrug efflux pump subunit AcrA (membrane-fusion protein)